MTLITRRGLVRVSSPPIVRAQFLGSTARPTEGAELDALRNEFRAMRQRRAVLAALFAGPAALLHEKLARGAVKDQYGNTLNASGSFPPFTGLNINGGSGPVGFPGQSTNPVGYAAAPGYPGTLTPASGGFVNNATYSFLLIDGGTSTPSINATGTTFIGCYIGSSTSAVTGHAQLNALGPITLNYTTIGPSWSVIGGTFPPMPPGGGGYTTWPTALGNGIPATQGTDYGPVSGGSSTPAGGMNFQNCDNWAFSNGVVFSKTNSSNPLTFNNCWIHDPCAPFSGAHTDGIGDVQGDASGDYIEFLTINHCTVACNCNSNLLAFQFNGSAPTLMNNVTITNNYWTANCSAVLATGLNPLTTVPTNYVFTGNVVAPYLLPEFDVLYENATARFSISGSGNKWRTNTILPASWPQVGSVTSANPYLWPNATANATDFTGPF